VEYKHQDTYNKAFFYTIYRIYFTHNYHIQKSVVQICTSLSLFITVNYVTDLWMILWDEKCRQNWQLALVNWTCSTAMRNTPWESNLPSIWQAMPFTSLLTTTTTFSWPSRMLYTYKKKHKKSQEHKHTHRKIRHIIHNFVKLMIQGKMY
jgi:hypothetical protein